VNQLNRLKNFSNIISYNKYQQHTKELSITLDKYYYRKDYKHVIITEDFQKFKYNPFRCRNTFNIYDNLIYFDNQKINKIIDTYLYGNLNKHSSINTIKLSDIQNINTNKTYILINENQCPRDIRGNKNIHISTKAFLDSATLSYAYQDLHKYSFNVIDLREFSSSDIEHCVLSIMTTLDNYNFLLTNQNTPGNDIKTYFQNSIDKIIFIGKNNNDIVKNMQNVFDNQFVIHENPNIKNVLDILHLEKPNLFIKDITQLKTIEMISNPHIYGKVAYVSADGDYGYIQPIASGGNYLHDINIQNIDVSIESNLNFTYRLLDLLIENDVKSVIFSCFNSNTRGPYLANLFLNSCRKQNKQNFKIYVMYPGAGHRHICKEFNNAPKTTAVKI
jgi:hypothetical protein